MRVKVETIANYLIVITSVTCMLLLGFRFLANPGTGIKSAAQGYRPGDKLTLNEVPVDFSKAPQTLLLVMSSQCRFCTASMPFYHDLLKTTSTMSKQTRVVAGGLLEKPASLQTYLNEYDLRVDEIVTIPAGKTKFQVTPTILLIDASGTIKGVWTGMLDTEQAQRDVVKVMTTGRT